MNRFLLFLIFSLIVLVSPSCAEIFGEDDVQDPFSTKDYVSYGSDTIRGFVYHNPDTAKLGLISVYYEYDSPSSTDTFNAYCAIYDVDSNGEPQNLIAITETKNISQMILGGTSGWVNFRFATPYPVINSDDYYVAQYVEGDGTLINVYNRWDYTGVTNGNTFSDANLANFTPPIDPASGLPQFMSQGNLNIYVGYRKL